MTDLELQELRYPIGKLQLPETITEAHIKDWIDVLEAFPSKLETLVRNLNDDQLDTPYRPKGWTVRQVVHHVSDSHHHSYIRFKWALTEDKPVIKYYFEKLWAELDDSKTAPIQMSLDHLKAVHFKLAYLLKSLTESEFNRTFIHPEYSNEFSLKQNTAIYAWH
ncbi:MAG: putative metal-dependent hydrolase, partial [Bacteroidia bacterium]|nr:putative metal-dependent hydrolase [Bacteroidia bacterium]